MLIAEPLSRAADTAYDLVDMQQDIVFAADFLNRWPVSVRRRDDAAAGGYGLQDNGADRIGAFAQDDVFDGARGLFP